MNKENKTTEELRDMINSAIRNNVNFDKVTAAELYIREPDFQGTNWDIPALSGPAELVEKAREAIALRVREMRLQYTAVQNLDSDDMPHEDD